MVVACDGAEGDVRPRGGSFLLEIFAFREVPCLVSWPVIYVGTLRWGRRRCGRRRVTSISMMTMMMLVQMPRRPLLTLKTEYQYRQFEIESLWCPNTLFDVDPEHASQ